MDVILLELWRHATQNVSWLLLCLWDGWNTLIHHFLLAWSNQWYYYTIDCIIHYNTEIVAWVVDLKAIIVLLPANSIKLIKKIDKSVFKTFKSVLLRCNTCLKISDRNTTLTKKYALMIYNDAWNKRIVNKKSKTISGFKVAGLYPIRFPYMQVHIHMF